MRPHAKGAAAAISVQIPVVQVASNSEGECIDLVEDSRYLGQELLAGENQFREAYEGQVLRRVFILSNQGEFEDVCADLRWKREECIFLSDVGISSNLTCSLGARDGRAL